MGCLTVIMLIGGYAYIVQATHGLTVTGMNDHVSWGLYISNMAFLVGVAAAAVILVMPAYVLHDVDFSRAVLIAEGVAVSALVMCLGFVTANSPGFPWKWWRLTPVIGLLNWPSSMLAWDVIALNGYLVLNLVIPFYILYSHFTGREPEKKKYVPFIYLSVDLGREHPPDHRVSLRGPSVPSVVELAAARAHASWPRRSPRGRRS